MKKLLYCAALSLVFYAGLLDAMEVTEERESDRIITFSNGGKDIAINMERNGMHNSSMLDFSGNQLTSFVLPGGLKHLQTLNLNGNQLTSFTIPDGLDNLEELDLSNNPQLSKLSAANQDTLTLRKLLVNGCALTAIFAGNQLPDSLERLEAMDNFLANIPNVGKSSQQRLCLILDNNNIRTFSKELATLFKKNNIFINANNNPLDGDSIDRINDIEHPIAWSLSTEEASHLNGRLVCLMRRAVSLETFNQCIQLFGLQLAYGKVSYQKPKDGSVRCGRDIPLNPIDQQDWFIVHVNTDGTVHYKNIINKPSLQKFVDTSSLNS